MGERQYAHGAHLEGDGPQSMGPSVAASAEVGTHLCTIPLVHYTSLESPFRCRSGLCICVLSARAGAGPAQVREDAQGALHRGRVVDWHR